MLGVDVGPEGGPLVELVGLGAVLVEEAEHLAFGFALVREPGFVPGPAGREIGRPGGVRVVHVAAVAVEDLDVGGVLGHAVLERNEDVVADGDPAVVAGAHGHAPAVDLDSHGGPLSRWYRRMRGSIERQGCEAVQDAPLRGSPEVRGVVASAEAVLLDEVLGDGLGRSAAHGGASAGARGVDGEGSEVALPERFAGGSRGPRVGLLEDEDAAMSRLVDRVGVKVVEAAGEVSVASRSYPVLDGVQGRVAGAAAPG